jgi:hypothetical protein
MKRGDVFTKILSEVSGRPEHELLDILEAFKATIPGQHKFDEEISDLEGECLLSELRKEKDGIANWLNKGYLQFLLRTQEPQGHA